MMTKKKMVMAMMKMVMNENQVHLDEVEVVGLVAVAWRWHLRSCAEDILLGWPTWQSPLHDLEERIPV